MLLKMQDDVSARGCRKAPVDVDLLEKDEYGRRFIRLNTAADPLWLADSRLNFWSFDSAEGVHLETAEALEWLARTHLDFPFTKRERLWLVEHGQEIPVDMAAVLARAAELQVEKDRMAEADRQARAAAMAERKRLALERRIERERRQVEFAAARRERERLLAIERAERQAARQQWKEEVARQRAAKKAAAAAAKEAAALAAAAAAPEAPEVLEAPIALPVAVSVAEIEVAHATI